MYEIGKEELKAVEKVFQQKKFFRYGGSHVSSFEKEWSQITGSKYTVSVTSGTAALICGLAAMGIGPGDEVIVPAYTFISTALAVTAIGAIPILADIDEQLLMDPDSLDKVKTARTKCIIPVHMQGMPCNMQKLMKWARKNKVMVLEDCCQAAGGQYQSKPLGTLGLGACFSFNEYKIISCGEGGAFITQKKKIADRAHMLQDGSCSVWPETGALSSAFFCSGNFRFNELNAAILRKQTKKLPSIIKRLQRTRNQILKQLELPTNWQWISSHDEKGQCGVCFLLKAPDGQSAQALVKKLDKTWDIHRPADSGRHIYSEWNVIQSKIGGHHPDWDCFKHPANKKIKTNYLEKRPLTDQRLQETVLLKTPYQPTNLKLQQKMKKMNQSLNQLKV